MNGSFDSDHKNGTLARRTLVTMLVWCGSTVALTIALSATAFFVVGRIASNSPSHDDAPRPAAKGG